jgi:hypothetical protein
MALPKQVQRQLDAAETLLTPAPAIAAPEPTQQPAPVLAAEASVVEHVEPPAPPVAPVAPPPQPPAPQADWEHKYRTLQGIHNSQLADLKRRMTELEQERNTLVAQLQARPVQAQPDATTAKDAEVFGEDLVNMVQRIAQATVGQTAQVYDGRLAVVEQNLAGATATVSKTAEELFYDALAKQVPDWETQNLDQGFLAWLDEVDPIYGVPRQTALTSAANERNAQRAASIFMAYKATLTPPPAAEPAPPARPTPAAQLEKQVAPRASGGAPITAPQEKPRFTVAQVQAFYQEVAQGKYRGREQAVAATEALINEALSEGRVVDPHPRQMAF